VDDSRSGTEPLEDEIELEESDDNVEETMREAVAAVEQVEGRMEADELGRLRREIDELRDRSVRTLADFDNFRKRADRERLDLRRYALVEPMREMLEVVDNLERALGSEGSVEDFKTGVELILRQMRDLVRRQGVREVPAEGEPFNPSVHEAVSRREEAGLVEPRVVRELQRGYQLYDRLLRPAIVEVAVPADEPAPGAAGGASGDADETA
jgi:molecular chaperone GrpE